MMNLDVNGTLIGDREDNIQINTTDVSGSKATTHANSVQVNGVTVWGRDNSPTSPPDGPTDLVASDGTSTEYINITWNHSASSSIKFNVYKDGTYSFATFNKWFDDNNTIAGVTHSYYVKAIYIDHTELGESIASNTDTGHRDDIAIPVPVPINNLSASDGTYTDKVEVYWDVAGDSDNYELARDSQGNIISTPTSPPFQDYNIVVNTQHAYWVRGINVSGPGPWSLLNYGHAGVLGSELPGAIGDFNATDNLIGEIKCTWTEGINTNTVDIYFNGTLLTSDVSSPYTHTVVPGTYSFYVIANNSSGSKQSNSDDGTSVEVPAPGTITDFAVSDGTIAGWVECTWTNTPDTDSYDIWKEDTYGAGDWGIRVANAISGDRVAAGSPGIVHNYKVRANNASSYTDSNIDDGYALDTRPPVAVNDFSATDGTIANGVACTWTENERTTSVDLYRLINYVWTRQVTDATSGVIIDITEINAINDYRVASVNQYGVVNSNTDSGHAAYIPTPIVDFSASDGTVDGFVECTWTTGSYTTRVDLWKEPTYGAGDWELKQSDVVSGVLQQALTPGTVRRYKVIASNSYDSIESNVDDGHPMIVAGSETITVDKNFIVPDYVTQVVLCMCGGGGSGGSDGQIAGGGYGGEKIQERILSGLTPGQVIACTIGVGGLPVDGYLAVGEDPSTRYSNGNPGTPTTFGTHFTATGGAGGLGNDSDQYPGNGASHTGCGGTFTDGLNGIGGEWGLFGNGGDGGEDYSLPGGVGAGGGGNSGDHGSGAGGRGQIVVSWGGPGMR